tara:strand:+ start:476 stop:886 length:411 start_codon:yes stop_codon:yes gene_type:complete
VKKEQIRNRTNDISLSAKEYEESDAVNHFSPNGKTIFSGRRIHTNKYESQCSTKHTVCLGYEKIDIDDDTKDYTDYKLGEVAGFINLDVREDRFDLEISTAHANVIELFDLDLCILENLRNFLNYSVKEYSTAKGA